MTLELPDETITEGSSTLDLFTDRYGLIRRFVSYVNGESPQEKILFFHGEGGNGKSLLLRFLRAHGCKWFGKYWNELNALGDEAFVERLQGAEEREYLAMPTVLMDFGQLGGGTLPKDDYFGPLGLARDIFTATEEKCKFPRFTFAKLCYEDAQGQADGMIQRILANDMGSWLATGADIASASAMGTVVKLASELVRKLQSKEQQIEKCWRKLGLEDGQARAIRKLDKDNLLAELPKFLVEDLKEFLGQQQLAQKKIILMFDTHESFWNTQERSAEGDGYFGKDLWLRKVLKGLAKHPKIILVVAGREPPRWSEATKYPIRREGLDLQTVEDLLEADARIYLQKAQVLDVPLQDSIIQYASVGADQVHPLYLGLCVDVVNAAKAEDIALTPQEFIQEAQGMNRPKALIGRLFTYVDTPTKQAVQALGACRSFDRELYNMLHNKLILTANFTVLTRFSFVQRQENNRYRIHDLLRRLFDENPRLFCEEYDDQGEGFTMRAHRTLEQYYREKSEVEFIYHLNRLDWEQSINPWVDLFDQARELSRYELCRLLIDLRQDLWVRGDFKLGQISASEGDFYAYLSQYDAASSKFNQAIDAYGTYLYTNPDDVGAQNNKGNALTKLGNLQAGRSDFGKALSSYEKAIAAYDQALSRAPDDVGAHTNKGTALQGLGDLQARRSDVGKALSSYETAIAAYDQALSRAPDLIQSHNNKGNALLRLGDLQAGRSDFGKALSSYERAIVAFDQALSLAPDYVNAHNNKGTALLRLGELQAGRSDFGKALSSYERAIAAYDQALTLAPDYVYTHNNKGNALLRLGDLWLGRSDIGKALSSYERAIAAYDEALALAPDYVYAHNNKGLALKSLGDLQAGRSDIDKALSSYERAIAAFDQALALAPDYVNAHNNKGTALRSLGDLQARRSDFGKALSSYERAIAAFDQALSLAPDYVNAHNNKGNALAKLGDLQAGRSDFGKALSSYERAIAAYDQVLTLAPDNPGTHNNKGNVLQSLGDLKAGLDQINEALATYQAAINSYDGALRLAPDYPLVLRNQGNTHERLGLLLEKNGQPEQAIAQYQSAIAVYSHMLDLVPGDEAIRQRRDGLLVYVGGGPQPPAPPPPVG